MRKNLLIVLLFIISMPTHAELELFTISVNQSLTKILDRTGLAVLETKQFNNGIAYRVHKSFKLPGLPEMNVMSLWNGEKMVSFDFVFEAHNYSSVIKSMKQYYSNSVWLCGTEDKVESCIYIEKDSLGMIATSSFWKELNGKSYANISIVNKAFAKEKVLHQK